MRTLHLIITILLLTAPLPAQTQPATLPSTQPAATMDLLVIDRITQQPITGLNVLTAGVVPRFRGVTGADGRAIVPLPATTNYNYFNLAVRGKGYVYTHLLWFPQSSNMNGEIPKTYTMEMDPSVSIHGRVLDDAGAAIANANVILIFEDHFDDPHEFLDIGDSKGYSLVKTNAKGVFTFNNAPTVCDKTYVAAWDYHHVIDAESLSNVYSTPQKLRDGTATFTLEHGVVYEGIVTDPDGKPVSGAAVQLPNWPRLPPQLTTADGKFAFAFKSGADVNFTILAPGYAPHDEHLTMPPQEQHVTIKISAAQ